LEKLRQARPDDDTETVHEIRTTIKLLRTLTWFARPVLAPTTRAGARSGLQHAARLLAARRNLTAMQSTLRNLAEETGTPRDRDVIHRTGALLAARAPKIQPSTMYRQRDEAIARVQKTIRRLIRAAATATGWKSPKKRLRKARAAAERAQAMAQEEPTPVHLHEWRKKAKRLLYLLKLFHPNPQGKKKLEIEAVDALQHDLGDHHDTVVLQEHLARHHPGHGAESEHEQLFNLLGERLERLHEQAEKTARKI
jgi:CHAD domain-containing protein